MASQSVVVATQELVYKAQGREEGEEVARAAMRAVESLSSHTSVVRSGEAILPEENVEGQVRGREGVCGCSEME